LVVFGTGRDCLALSIGTTIRIFNAARLFWLHSAHQSHILRRIRTVHTPFSFPTLSVYICIPIDESVSASLSLSQPFCICCSSPGFVQIYCIFGAVSVSVSPHLSSSVCLRASTSSGYTVFQFSPTLSNLGFVCLILITL
jgi:hypothetical protein